MPETIMVYPSSPAANGLKHPIAGVLPEVGAPWPLDGFTCRRLVDGDVVRAPVEKSDAQPAEAAIPTAG